MYRHNFTFSLKNTVLIEVFHKIKIYHQSRQLQKQSALGINVIDGTSIEKFVLNEYTWRDMQPKTYSL